MRSESLVATTLGAICERQGGAIQTGPFGSQLHASDYIASGTPVVMPADIVRGRISTASIARVGSDHVVRLSQHQLRLNDIVFSRRGDVTRFARVTERESGWLCGTGCLKVRVGVGDLALPEWVSLALDVPEVKEWLVRHAVGATMPNLNTAILSAVPIEVPPIEEQHEAVRVCFALDDRIDLLRRTNTTLEAIAQALFKSWFVDFDPVRAKAEGRDPEGMDAPTATLFPDAMDSCDRPKGWLAKPLYEAAVFVNGAAYKAFQPNSDSRGLPIIKIAELKNGITAQTAHSDVQMPEKFRLADGDILFSWSGNPDTSIDTFIWAGGQAWLNQHIFRVIPHASDERWFLFLLLRYLRPVFTEMARNKQTTGLGHVTVNDLKRLIVVVPPKDIANEFNGLVSPLLEAMQANVFRSKILSEARDTLLPRLISGKLRLSEAEAQLEAAGA